MKPIFLLGALVIFHLYPFSGFGNQVTSTHKIQLKGKVLAVNSNKSVLAKVAVRAQGVSLAIATDGEGIFSAAFAEVNTFTIVVNSPGYEELEQSFSLPELKSDSSIQVAVSLTPLEKLKLTGTILDQKTSKPVEAEFDIYMDNDMVKEDVKIARNGLFVESITNFGWYIIDISAKGYLDYSDTLWVTNCSRPELTRKYLLTPIEAGITVRLKNIQFNFGKTTLHEDSFEELNDVADWLKKNPTLKLEIGGHTDSDGPDDYNLILSQGRAQAVVDYLISQGADHSQLVAKGYGETKPIDTHETMQAKSINRRVEFTILGN